ncbi:MAG: hypothetical protein KC656_36350, partial [Myxococcales bacterium]|nr:hypothetical protein [Myxococcales bacterium]
MRPVLGLPTALSGCLLGVPVVETPPTAVSAAVTSPERVVDGETFLRAGDEVVVVLEASSSLDL